MYSGMWKELSRLPDLERRLGAIKGQFRDDLAIAQNEKAADSDRYRYAKRLSVRQRQSIYNEPQAGFSQYQEDDGVGQTRGHPDNIDV